MIPYIIIIVALLVVTTNSSGTSASTSSTESEHGASQPCVLMECQCSEFAGSLAGSFWHCGQEPPREDRDAANDSSCAVIQSTITKRLCELASNIVSWPNPAQIIPTLVAQEDH